MVVTGNGYETVCTSFTVRRGSNPPLTVTLVPADPAPLPVPDPVVTPVPPVPRKKDPIADTVREKTPQLREGATESWSELSGIRPVSGIWTTQDGTWTGATGGGDVFARSDEAVADFVMEADITVTSAEGSAAIVFRASGTYRVCMRSRSITVEVVCG